MNKKLLVYFSYTGNTRSIADMIKKSINCDVLELKPKVPYSNDYQSVVDEYQNNENDKKTCELEDYNINLNDYDTIIIGSPVWWYSITPVIRTFLKNNNLSKKKVYAYATNAGWLGRTFKEVEEICLSVISTMNIVFNENNLVTKEEEINKWIGEI